MSVEGTTRPLPDPFIVIATQNPIEYEGTYPLPEAQLDRFLFKLLVGYPRGRPGAGGARPPPPGPRSPRHRSRAGVRPVADAADPGPGPAPSWPPCGWRQPVLDYVVALVRATRESPSLSLGRVAPGRRRAAPRGQGLGLAVGPRLRHPRRGEGGGQAGPAPPDPGAARAGARGGRPPTGCSTGSWPRSRRPGDLAARPARRLAGRGRRRRGRWPCCSSWAGYRCPGSGIDGRSLAVNLALAGGGGARRAGCAVAPAVRRWTVSIPAVVVLDRPADHHLGGGASTRRRWLVPPGVAWPTSWPRRCRPPTRRVPVRLPPAGRGDGATADPPAAAGAGSAPTEMVVRTEGPLGPGRASSSAGSLPGALRVLPAVPFVARRRSCASRRARILRGGAALGPGPRRRHRVRPAARVHPRRRVPPDRLGGHRPHRQRPIVRTYRAERNQTVLVLLDNGRIMAGRVDGRAPRRARHGRGHDAHRGGHPAGRPGRAGGLRPRRVGDDRALGPPVAAGRDHRGAVRPGARAGRVELPQRGHPRAGPLPPPQPCWCWPPSW